VTDGSGGPLQPVPSPGILAESGGLGPLGRRWAPGSPTLGRRAGPVAVSQPDRFDRLFGNLLWVAHPGLADLNDLIGPTPAACFPEAL
jgi:hypothetical protein